MITILAIGGAVIKTAREELLELTGRKAFDVLIHNGGSIFHDFQIPMDPQLEGRHSYPLDELLNNDKTYWRNQRNSSAVWYWIKGYDKGPVSSVTRTCTAMGIDVLLFTVLGGDFWQMHRLDEWSVLADHCAEDFNKLTHYMSEPFHYICMGSAVVHPEVFIKVVGVNGRIPEGSYTTVVDFRNMYRPMTRVAKYGEYRCMTHKDFLQEWMKRSERHIPNNGNKQ